MKCHNQCGSMGFGYFLKTHYPELYNDYKFEAFREESDNKPAFVAKLDDETAPEPQEIKTDIYQYLTPLSELPDDHEAKKYVLGRQLPKRAIDKMYFTPSYKLLVEEFNPKYKNGKYRIPADPRIVLLMKDANGNVTCCQGRKIRENNHARYITIKKDDMSSKLFGLDSIDRSKPIIVVEGPIDSLFLPNCLALCGGDVGESLKEFDKDKIILAFDNEPRKADTIDRMKRAIELGYSVVFWNIDTRYKDINDMVKNGIDMREILYDICKRSYSGLKAKIMMAEWAKLKTKTKRSFI
jgi:hypothetical protein